MSNEELMQKVAGILRPAVTDAAREEVGLRMKDLSDIVQKEMESLPSFVQKELEGLPGIVRKEMDACLDGKCDAIAERLVAKLPKSEASTLKVEDIGKAVQAAMEAGGSPFNVEGHSAHDILDCPTCKPIVVNKLWESPEYRQAVAEKVCEDEECRNLFLKKFEEKGYGVTENVGKDESWAERRLRERKENQ